ncbi:hypothetical protein KIW84_043050 [Lathyrus oleraceus]|uniref:DUF4283 domain-containing protein n=1 Tax=Pisum sativum TaxID=3888 RepID=A0A9D5ARA9_PEA|nr:hypothetical protein KIW84_043050 [Pisum sativum]
MMKKVQEEKQVVSLKPPKSFVEAVNNVCDIPVSRLPKLCTKGDRLSIIIPEEGKWSITSLGKGYFEFLFSTLEDVRRVRSITSWNLSPGFLKLFLWTKDFNPAQLKKSSTQVGIRIHGLSQKYWRPNFFFAVASSVGTPLRTDYA